MIEAVRFSETLVGYLRGHITEQINLMTYFAFYLDVNQSIRSRTWVVFLLLLSEYTHF